MSRILNEMKKDQRFAELTQKMGMG